MSPIDDELRALLSSRAGRVDPAPDPLGGIENRARGLRRRRIVSSVSGAAAVVVAVAVAVPLLVSGSGSTAVRQPGDPSPTPDSVALDPQAPWAVRGEQIEPHLLDDCECSPLYVRKTSPDLADYQVYGISTSSTRPGLATIPTSVGNLVKHTPAVTPLPDDLRVLTWVEPQRLIVVAAPDALVEYSSEGNGFQQISDVGQAPKGVGIVPIAAEDPNDSIRVTEADGTVVTEPAPDWTPPFTGTPVNVLDTWVHRGDAQTVSGPDLIQAYERATGKTGHGSYRSLYDGTHNGLRFTIGQAWDDGEAAAHTVAFDSSGTFFLGPETPRDPWVLGAVFATGGARDLLVLLPRPGAGRIGYSPDAASAFGDVASGRSDLDAVGLVDRDPRAQQDRVQVHRGDDSIILTEGIAKLTCGDKECG
ncbi:MAG: hypothetical protein JWO22_3565 [Frankiales bacterium]|nr:hypothetical protein [Frankiales bacterium]